MTRNGAYVESKIIDSNHLGKKAQVGYDLTIKTVQEVIGPITFDQNSKLNLPGYRELKPDHLGYYHLNPLSAYTITFDQGLKKLEKGEWAQIIQRSSFNRVGTEITGSVYDPGFEISEEVGLGASMYTGSIPIAFPKHVRAAQLLIHECEDVDNMYCGRWQNKN